MILLHTAQVQVFWSSNQMQLYTNLNILFFLESILHVVLCSFSHSSHCVYRTDLDYPIGTVERRNQRERYRVQSINSTFRVLEAMLPSPRKFGKLKKPSKADILRNAIIYIENLQCLVNGGTPSIKEIKQIHEQTTPQKGEKIALPALELACDEIDIATNLPAFTDNNEEHGTVKRSLYNNQCLYHNSKGSPYQTADSDLYAGQWLTTPEYDNGAKLDSLCTSHYPSNHNLASDLGCSKLTYPGDNESILGDSFVPIM